MKILFDHQIFSWQDKGGISRYFISLQSELTKHQGLEIFNATLISNNMYLNGVSNQVWKLFPGFYIPGKTQLIKLIDKIFTKITLNQSEYDIFHPTYYDDYFLSGIGGKPYVVTVFDMIHELYKHDFPHDRTSELKKKVVSNAAHIIAISQSTKDDLVRLFGISPKRITVTHLASSLNPSNLEKIDLPQKYILYVGDRGKYKNFTRFLSSLQPIMKKDSSIHLVCVGGKNVGQKSSSRIQYMQLNDRELTYAYAHAQCLVIPALYEGFGLPLLEAMQCGCPVASSSTASLKEVGSAAATYFDAKNRHNMSDVIAQLISDDKLRQKLIRRGYDRAKFFSWKRCATETLEVYHQIVRENSRCNSL